MQPLANVTPLKPAARAGSVQVTGVGQIYKTSGQDLVALSDVSIEVKPGRFVVLVGPSGCGKSSLLMMMAGLRPQTSGDDFDQRRADRRSRPGPGRRGVPGAEPVSVADRRRERRISVDAARRSQKRAPHQGGRSLAARGSRRLRQTSSA